MKSAPEFRDLAAEIRMLARDKTIVYIPNPGNFGDGLIRSATKAFLFDNQLWHIEINVGFRGGRFQLLPFLLQRNKYLFIYGGGGAWCEASNFGMGICRFISRFTNALIVLPTTYELPVEGLDGFLFRRDKAESAVAAPHADFCHDMALYLAARSSVPWRGTRKTIASGNFFRTDNESRFRPEELPADNIDLSRRGNHMSNSDDFFGALAPYREVNTDRLHVAIASAILGAQVNLHTGSYFKIKAIHEASLIPMFRDRIRLHGPDLSLV